jgi:hypothetical protein
MLLDWQRETGAAEASRGSRIWSLAQTPRPEDKMAVREFTDLWVFRPETGPPHLLDIHS